MCVAQITFLTLPKIESNNSKCYPPLPDAWVPANAGTHAEPLHSSTVVCDQTKGTKTIELLLYYL